MFLDIRRALNKIFWDKREKIANYEITFIHRGAHEDRKTIPFSIITKIGPSWFIYKTVEEEAFIPFHRITAIKNTKTKRVIWKSARY